MKRTFVIPVLAAVLMILASGGAWGQEEPPPSWLNVVFTGTVVYTDAIGTENIFQIGDSVTGNLIVTGTGYPVYNLGEQGWRIFFDQHPDILLKRDATSTHQTITTYPQWNEGHGELIIDFMDDLGLGHQTLMSWGYEYLEWVTPSSGEAVNAATFSPQVAGAVDFITVEWAKWGDDPINILDGYRFYNIYITLTSWTCMTGYLCDLDPTLWPIPPSDQAAIDAFIVRCYQQFWGREPEQGNIDYWRIGLIDGSQTALDLISFLVGLEPFTGRSLSDQEFIGILHEAFFNTPVKGEDLQGWLGDLADGTHTRTSLLEELLYSAKFQGVCARMGISVSPGNV